MRTAALSLLAALLTLLATRPSAALPGGQVQIAADSSFFMTTFTQEPSETWTFSTFNLSPGGDTVIHVQDLSDPNGRFVAGNDDDGATLASNVVVPAIGVTRMLRVVVRSFSASSRGTAGFSAISSLGNGQSFFGVPFGGTRQFVPSLALGSHVMTTQPPGAVNDTVLLVVRNDVPSHAIAYDDDDGLLAMSWLHLPEACPDGCDFVVANFSPTAAPGFTNLIFDQDADVADADGDGLGDGLESSIFTLPHLADSDRDGVDDGEELLGVDQAPFITFPLMGADPRTKDIFLEVDWVTCPSCTNPNQDQLTGPTATQVAQRFLPARVHLDIGVTNTDPSTRTQWGNWGGANAQSSNAFCTGLTPLRAGRFHHQITQAGLGSGLLGACHQSSSDASRTSHELGHTLGLEHGGRPHVAELNCKPNYPSPMNYAYEGDFTNAPTFSHGTLPALNPSSMTERSVPLPDNIIALLGNPNREWRFKVDLAQRWVDWNRDGQFLITPQRGIPLSTPGRHDCGGTMFADAELKDAKALLDPALTWHPQANRLLLFGREPVASGQSRLKYFRVSRSSIDSCNGPFTEMFPHQDCAGVKNAPMTTLSTQTRFAPAVSDLPDGRVLMVVATGSPVRLNAYTLNNDSWSGATQLPSSTDVNGDPSALRVGAAVHVWAPTATRLKRWIFQSGAWSQPAEQAFNTGRLIVPMAGIGVARGAQDGSSTFATYAAIVTAPSRDLVFVREQADGRWAPINAWTQIGVQRATARPGLAFAPFSPAEPAVGRFYLAWRAPDGSIPPGGLFSITEGNVTPSPVSVTRRLVWLPPETLMGNFVPPIGGVSLLFDPSRDRNLRALARGANELYFGPLADGIINVELKDMDDYVYLDGALRASLGKEPFLLP